MSSPSAEDVVQAIYHILDPATDPGTRQISHQVVEQFRTKTDAAICIDLSYGIFSMEGAASSVRFMGMQLLHDCVQQRWQELSDDVILRLKQYAANLFTEALVGNDNVVKHGVSLFIVELIKRIWPQCWPNLMAEMFDAVDRDDSVLDIVMLVLERLSQDIGEGDAHLSSSRRQELKHSLSKCCTDGALFRVVTFKLLQHTSPEHVYDPVHGYLARRVLLTLAAFLEWCPLKPFFAHDYQLLEMLCSLVSQESLRLEAVECLIALAERKGVEQEDRQATLLLFQRTPMEIFLQAASTSGLNTAAGSKALDSYGFLKRLCTLLLRMGTHQLLFLWGTKDKAGVKARPGVGEPENFALYLDILLEFLQHDSLYVCNQTVATLPSFLNHELVRESPALKERLPKLLSVCLRLLVKPDAPFDCTSARSLYIAADFVDGLDLHKFWATFRILVMEVLGSLTLLIPHNVAELIAVSVTDLVQACNGQQAGLTASSPLVHQCEAVQSFADKCSSVLAKLPSGQRPDSALLVLPLETVLAWEVSSSLLIVRYQIAMLESLFVMLEFAPAMLQAVLQKLFMTTQLPSALALQERDIDAQRIRGGMGFVRLCDMYAHAMAQQSLLDGAYEMVKAQWDTSTMRLRQFFSEGLMCACKALPTFEQQQTVVNMILQPACDIYLSDAVQRAVSSPAEFAEFVGMSSSACGASPEVKELHTKQRINLAFAAHVLTIITKRSGNMMYLRQAQSSAGLAGIGIALAATNSGGSAITANPGWQPVQQLLPHAFRMISTLSEFSKPENQGLLGADFEHAFELTLSDKAPLLGIDNTQPEFKSRVKETPVTPIQKCLYLLYEACLSAIGTCGRSFGGLFYSMPGVAEQFQQQLMRNMLTMPCLYLKMLIRMCLARLVLNCPPEYFSTFLHPVLALFFNVIVERIKLEWTKTVSRQGDLAAHSEDDGFDEQMDRLCQAEVIDDFLARSLLKDIAWFWVRLFPDSGNTQSIAQTSGTAGNIQTSSGTAEPAASHSTAMDEDDEEAPAGSDNSLQEYILSTPALCQPVLASCLTGLVFPDANFSNRAGNILIHILAKTADQWAPHPNSYQQLLDPVLQAINVHGEHVGNFSTYIHLLMVLYPRMLEVSEDTITSLLARLPGVSQEMLTDLRKSFSTACKVKKRRDFLRRVLDGVVGKSTSEQHKLAVPESFLPRLQLPGSKSMAEAEVENHVDNVLLLPDLGLPNLFGPQD
ncbi:exportin-5-like isoform X1 [Sycon ciliatum]|uniref:exportin-5-like isoform X1 n=1 Tax=Sycon ciliatum TaxID=27933 RepID=UPI0031F64699